jgi:hypothetical protein
MADCTTLAIGSNDDHPAKRLQSVGKRLQACGMDTIIIGN